jgi:YfiR/HmsC-like
VLQLMSNRIGKGMTTDWRPIGEVLSLRKVAACCLVLGLLSCTLGGGIQAQASNEYQVKAAFLYNFAKFVDWPAEAFGDRNAQLVICVVGDDPFGGALDQAINGKSIGGRSLAVRRLKWGQELRSCHVLYISSSERKRLAQIIQSLRGASVLTVGEMGEFAQQGGIINFIWEANKVRFEINSQGSDQARLKISSKLLSLAKHR